MLVILGYLASALVGISLGLIGGGGSILTVPILVYLMGLGSVEATAYSLFIVGLSSAVGLFPKWKAGEVNLKTAVIFGLPSIAAVYLTRKLLVPALPEVMFTWGDWVLSKPMFIMLIFAIIMLAASFSMIRDKKASVATEGEQQFNYPLILLEGLLVGAITGLVGAGGGFLIIPALVMLSKLPMKQAVGTSLAIIAAKSLIGFLGDLSNMNIQWDILLGTTGAAVLGIFLGTALSRRISGEVLKKGFGWFVLIMGIFIIYKELSKPAPTELSKAPQAKIELKAE